MTLYVGHIPGPRCVTPDIRKHGGRAECMDAMCLDLKLETDGDHHEVALRDMATRRWMQPTKVAAEPATALVVDEVPC